MSEHTADRQLPAWSRWVALALFLALAFAAGWIGSVAQGDDVGLRYLSFERPAWAPPPEAFGIVWPLLYVAIGIAGWRVWLAAGSVGAGALPLGLWALQLVLNAAWPAVFFGEERFAGAAVVIVALDAVVIATIVAFQRWDRPAAWLLTPYLLWLLYATALNVALLVMN